MRFVALDFETSGLTPGHHAPVALGVALMEGAEVIARREWLFAPPTNKKGKVIREYSVEALQVSATTWPRIKREGLAAREVVSDLARFAHEHRAGHLPVVSFNAAFDLAWYADVLFLAGRWCKSGFLPAPPPLGGPWHCAYMRARAQLDLPGYTLDQVAASLGQRRETRIHGALEDAILAGRVWTVLADA